MHTWNTIVLQKHSHINTFVGEKATSRFCFTRRFGSTKSNPLFSYYWLECSLHKVRIWARFSNILFRQSYLLALSYYSNYFPQFRSSNWTRYNRRVSFNYHRPTFCPDFSIPWFKTIAFGTGEAHCIPIFSFFVSSTIQHFPNSDFHIR